MAEGEGEEEASRQFYFVQMAPVAEEEEEVAAGAVAAAAAEAPFLEKMLNYDEISARRKQGLNITGLRWILKEMEG